MVSSRCILLTLFIWTGSATAESIIHVDIENRKAQLGYPIVVTIVAVDVKANIEKINLATLENNFALRSKEVIEDNEDPRWPGKNIQKLRLRLYANKTGDLKVPSLYFEELLSAESHVEIIPGIAKDKPVLVELSLSSRQISEREATRVQIQITTADIFARLKSEFRPDFYGFDLYELPSQRIISADNKQLRKLTLVWYLIPISDGQYRLRLPPVEYHLDGMVERRYYFPPLELSVNALPSYIPPTLPVGNISIQSIVKAATILDTEQLAYWHIKLTSENSGVDNLPVILNQIQSDKTIQFLASELKTQVQVEFSSIHSEANYIIPFRVKKSGIAVLPDLKIQTFNTKTGRLDTIIHKNRSMLIVSQIWRIILLLVVMLIGIILSKNVYIFCIEYRLHAKVRSCAIKTLRASSSMTDFRQGMQLVAESEGWPSNLSLRDWKSHWRQRYQYDDKIDKIFKQLSQACYGGCYLEHSQALLNFDKLKAAFLEIYLKRRKNK